MYIRRSTYNYNNNTTTIYFIQPTNNPSTASILCISSIYNLYIGKLELPSSKTTINYPAAEQNQTKQEQSELQKRPPRKENLQRYTNI